MIEWICSYSDGCSNCDCGLHGTATLPTCNQRACTVEQIVPDFCVECATGYTLIDGECVPECGAILYCSR